MRDGAMQGKCHHLMHSKQVFGYYSFKTCAIILIDLNRGSHMVINAALIVHSALENAVCCMSAVLLLMWGLPWGCCLGRVWLL